MQSHLLQSGAALNLLIIRPVHILHTNSCWWCNIFLPCKKRCSRGIELQPFILQSFEFKAFCKVKRYCTYLASCLTCSLSVKIRIIFSRKMCSCNYNCKISCYFSRWWCMISMKCCFFSWIRCIWISLWRVICLCKALWISLWLTICLSSKSKMYSCKSKDACFEQICRQGALSIY